MINEKSSFLLRYVSGILCCINAAICLWVIFDYRLPGFTPLIFMFPTAAMMWRMSGLPVIFVALPVIFVVVVLLIAMVLVTIKHLKLASLFAMIGGLLTIPLGVLGVLAGIMLYKLSKKERVEAGDVK